MAVVATLHKTLVRLDRYVPLLRLGGVGKRHACTLQTGGAAKKRFSRPLNLSKRDEVGDLRPLQASRREVLPLIFIGRLLGHFFLETHVERLVEELHQTWHVEDRSGQHLRPARRRLDWLRWLSRFRCNGLAWCLCRTLAIEKCAANGNRH
jgi:hypothetical protein